MMKTPERKPVLTVGLFALILGCMLLPGISREASGAEDLSQKVADAGKSIEKSVDHAAKETGAYLKSDSFHRKVKRVVDGGGRGDPKRRKLGRKQDRLDVEKGSFEPLASLPASEPAGLVLASFF